MANKEQKLFAEFPPVTTERWEEAIQSGPQGSRLREKAGMENGGRVQRPPYYRAENLEGLRFLGSQCGEFPYVPGNQEKQRLADPANDRSRVPARGHARIHAR